MQLMRHISKNMKHTLRSSILKIISLPIRSGAKWLREKLKDLTGILLLYVVEHQKMTFTVVVWLTLQMASTLHIYIT